jgi:2-polyprenyl-6-methoxyphenol hydroxylase-like FAD-dependent oxidoreductase
MAQSGTEHGAIPLIAVGGPVGLAAALFLKRDGMATRVAERAEVRSPFSRALAVNPRTMEILEPTGVTAKMLALGLPMRGARMWRGEKTVAELSFKSLRSKYPFMLALSQSVTERLLEEALLAAGGSVERGVELIHCRNAADHVEVELRPAAENAAQRHVCPWLLAADGAHSTVRSEVGIDFTGSSFERPWFLADLPLETSLPDDLAHAFFLDEGGFVFCVRVVEDRNRPSPDGPMWRVIGNFPDPLERLPSSRPAGPPVWSSSFHIAHRIVACMQEGHVYFAGDAAHIHSPIGARGMNLGIEDAWVFSRLAASGGLDRYDAMRRPIDRNVVVQVERLSRLARGESALSRLLRRFILPRAVQIGMFRDRMMSKLTGLDHRLPTA